MKTKFLIGLFLCWCSVANACGKDNDIDDNNGPDPNPGPVETEDVRIYVTTNNRSMDLTQATASFNEKANMSPTTITLDPSVRYQEMDGFGTAITGSSCFNLMQMSEADRMNFLKETFDPENGLGHSYIRISIGCSDFSLSEYTCCDEPGIENFALQSEEINYVIPIVKEILKINPSVKVMGSPWTCPRWMKVNNLTDKQPFNSWTSGQLNPDYYQDYATYFVKWIDAMEEAGVPIYSITIQNEPLNRGNSASLYMGWEEQRDFIKQALGPKIKAAHAKVKVYVFDHNYNYDNISSQYQYPIRIYNDAEAAGYVEGAAYHNYGGNRSELNNIHDQRPDKELVFTETSIGTWNDGRDVSTRLIEDMREVALGTINNWCKGVIVWNLMLDTNRGPNRDGGCQTCYGAVDINNQDFKTITRNSHYYIISHLSTVVKPGAVRIGTNGYTASGITYSGFQNTDGSYAFVLLNENTDSKTITLSDGKNYFTYEVPAKSVVSYRWK